MASARRSLCTAAVGSTAAAAPAMSVLITFLAGEQHHLGANGRGGEGGRAARLQRGAGDVGPPQLSACIHAYAPTQTHAYATAGVKHGSRNEGAPSSIPAYMHTHTHADTHTHHGRRGEGVKCLYTVAC
eukprot:254662-Pelagomonas_calceolata.AAC.1